MATKKQKRTAALAKRAEFMDQEKYRGLVAQGREQERRAQAAKVVKVEADRINKHHRAVLQKAFGN